MSLETVIKLENHSFSTHCSTPGKRLKYLRTMTGKSRASISKKYDIPEISLKAWENRSKPLTFEALKKCLAIYEQEGVVCGGDWIQEGDGPYPKHILAEAGNGTHTMEEPLDLAHTDGGHLIRDISFFRKHYSDGIILLVTDETMTPYYKPGTYVGGRLRSRAQLSSIHEHDCILLLVSGRKILRRVIVEEKNIQFLKLCPTAEHDTSIRLEEVEGFAPVIWSRLPDIGFDQG